MGKLSKRSKWSKIAKACFYTSKSGVYIIFGAVFVFFSSDLIKQFAMEDLMEEQIPSNLLVCRGAVKIISHLTG